MDERIESMGGEIQVAEASTEYAFLYRLRFDPKLDSLVRLADYIEDVEGAEVLSIGNALELVKDLGDATEVSHQYEMGNFVGTHAIGHTRMATESDVDISLGASLLGLSGERRLRSTQWSAHQLLEQAARARANRPPLSSPIATRS